jgi:hypothetical protein
MITEEKRACRPERSEGQSPALRLASRAPAGARASNGAAARDRVPRRGTPNPPQRFLLDGTRNRDNGGFLSSTSICRQISPLMRRLRRYSTQIQFKNNGRARRERPAARFQTAGRVDPQSRALRKHRVERFVLEFSPSGKGQIENVSLTAADGFDRESKQVLLYSRGGRT